jgi:hypothetical protein
MNAIAAVKSQIEAIVDHVLRPTGYSNATLHEILESLRRGQERIEVNLIIRKPPFTDGDAA